MLISGFGLRITPRFAYSLAATRCGGTSNFRSKIVLGRGGGTGRPACRQAGALDFMTNIYVIKSVNRNYIYIGITNNTKRRVEEHNSGKSKTTRSYRPFVVLFTEEYQDRPTARKREIYLKSGCGKEWIKANYLPRWRNW